MLYIFGMKIIQKTQFEVYLLYLIFINITSKTVKFMKTREKLRNFEKNLKKHIAFFVNLG